MTLLSAILTLALVTAVVLAIVLYYKLNKKTEEIKTLAIDKEELTNGLELFERERGDLLKKLEKTISNEKNLAEDVKRKSQKLKNQDEQVRRINADIQKFKSEYESKENELRKYQKKVAELTQIIENLETSIKENEAHDDQDNQLSELQEPEGKYPDQAAIREKIESGPETQESDLGVSKNRGRDRKGGSHPRQGYADGSRGKSIETSALPTIDFDSDTEVVISKRNEAQTDDLRIGFSPNNLFQQPFTYEYPVVKMPHKGSLLKLPRTGRSGTKGFVEDSFLGALRSSDLGLDICDNFHLAIPYFNRPYEPDIVLKDENKNLYIDVEIDEPYDGYYRYPRHYTDKDQPMGGKDEIRDLFFIESGWVVIRFTEKQIHTAQSECIAYIKSVLHSLDGKLTSPATFAASEKQWDYDQAVRWQLDRYREDYLGIDGFGEKLAATSIIMDNGEVESIENKIQRTKIINVERASSEHEVMFDEKSHIYTHPNDSTGNAAYTSVTTLVDRYFPFDTDRYLEKKAGEEGKSILEVRKEHSALQEEAAEKGTKLHEQIENFLNGMEYSQELPELKMFIEFYNKEIRPNGFEFVEAEKKIILPEYNIAGTVDALFRNPLTNSYFILDWKRSKKLIIDDGFVDKRGAPLSIQELSHLSNGAYFKYLLQQNFYKYILEKSYKCPISSMKLIVLHEKYPRYYKVPLQDIQSEVKFLLKSTLQKI